MQGLFFVKESDFMKTIRNFFLVGLSIGLNFSINSTAQIPVDIELKTFTASGKQELERMIADSSLQVAQEQIIQVLAQSKKLQSSLKENLKKLSEAEKDMLWFWKHNDIESEQLLENSAHLSRSKLSSQLAVPSVFCLPAVLILCACGLAIIEKGNLSPVKKFIPLKEKIPNFFYDTQKEWHVKPKAVIMDTLLLLSIPGIYKAYKGFKNQKTYSALQQKMINVASYFSTLRKIASTLENKKELTALASTLKLENCSESTKKLVTILESKTFKGKPSFFSNQVKALDAFRLMLGLKENLQQAIQGIGTLDACLAITKELPETEY